MISANDGFLGFTHHRLVHWAQGVSLSPSDVQVLDRSNRSPS
jgi:hypothetical protein